jgi:hypothetical protein
MLIGRASCTGRSCASTSAFVSFRVVPPYLLRACAHVCVIFVCDSFAGGRTVPVRALRACGPACVRACVRACMRACVRACVRARAGLLQLRYMPPARAAARAGVQDNRGGPGRNATDGEPPPSSQRSERWRWWCCCCWKTNQRPRVAPYPVCWQNTWYNGTAAYDSPSTPRATDVK